MSYLLGYFGSWTNISDHEYPWVMNEKPRKHNGKGNDGMKVSDKQAAVRGIRDLRRFGSLGLIKGEKRLNYI